MSSKLTKLMFFLSSYFPLFLILTFTKSNTWGYWNLTPLIIGLSALLWLCGWFIWAKEKSSEQIIIKKSKSKDPEVVAYIISYLLPMAGNKLSEFDGVVTIIIFFIVIMILNLNSNLVYINPVLNAIGYHLYEVELESGNEIMLITKAERLLVGQGINARRVAESIYLGEGK